MGVTPELPDYETTYYDVGKYMVWLDYVSDKLGIQSLRQKLWWQLMPGTTVEVKWPRGWYDIDDPIDDWHVSAETTDPNTAYRWYLEKYVGRQGWDWDWKIGSFRNDSLLIKIRRKHQAICSIIALKWN